MRELEQEDQRGFKILWEWTKKILKNFCIEYPLLSNLCPGKITRAHQYIYSITLLTFFMIGLFALSWQREEGKF